MRAAQVRSATGAPTLNDASPDADEIVPTARVGVRRDMGGFALRAAAYSGFRAPTLNELHRPFRVGNDVTEANAALKSERLAGAEIGIGGANWRAALFSINSMTRSAMSRSASAPAHSRAWASCLRAGLSAAAEPWPHRSLRHRSGRKRAARWTCA